MITGIRLCISAMIALASVVMMVVTAWVLYVATELVFVEFVPHRRYWKIVARHEGGGKVEVNYAPSEEERHWQAQFLGKDVSE